MSINFDCSNRIKPKLLREQKTEALLVFIRTTLEKSLEDIALNGNQFDIGTKEDNEHIYFTLKELLTKLQDCVVNATYLRNLTTSAENNRTLMMIAKKEEALMTYYDSIVKGIALKLPNGTPWIPELMIIALLSEWIIEEEKSTYLYPFLEDINYLELMERYDKVKLNTDSQKKEIIMNMYYISSYLIKRLKNIKYKTQSKASKKRKKRN